MRIVFIGDEQFLTYNKTRIMHATLACSGVDFQFVPVGRNSKSRLKRYFSYVQDYLRIATHLSRTKEGSILWLSEFKFTPPHALAAYLIARAKGMFLVGGPHTLSEDSAWLTEGALHDHPRPRSSTVAKHWFLRKRDAFVLRFFDAVQSYTPEYLARIGRLAPHLANSTVLFPIGFTGSLPDLSAQSATGPVCGPLKVVFWGIASALHGLELLPAAVKRLQQRGVGVKVEIYSPSNHFTTKVSHMARELSVSDSFLFDHATLISDNYHRLAGAHVAISHLVSPSALSKCPDVVNALSTNKLYEVLGLGLPLLIAGTPATRGIVDESTALLVAPGDSSSIVEVLLKIANGTIDCHAIARKGQRLACEHHTPQAMAAPIICRLEQLLSEKISS